MKVFWTGVLVGGIAVMPTLAHACGACIEDKVAATYDHSIVTQAAARGQPMVFGAIDGAKRPAGIRAGSIGRERYRRRTLNFSPSTNSSPVDPGPFTGRTWYLKGLRTRLISLAGW